MADCANCGEPLPEGAPACPNCGRIVANERRISSGEGVAFGCLAMIAALLVWAAAGVYVNDHFPSHPGKCGDVWAVRLYYGGTIALCLAALVGGIRAARRGAGGLAIFIILPALAVLLPASACAVSIFSSC